mgnify:CR=1 FL=1
MISIVGIVAKYREPKAFDIARWAIPWLRQNGKLVLVETGFNGVGGRSVNKKEIAKNVSAVIDQGKEK